jgi:hypothetical protein
MTFDIEKAARLRVVERDQGGLTVEPYLPMTNVDRSRLRPPSTHQGRVIPGEVETNTGEPVKAAGGKTAVPSRRIPEDA